MAAGWLTGGSRKAGNGGELQISASSLCIHGGMIPGAACDESGLNSGMEVEEQERESKRRILQVSPPPCTSKKEYPVGVTEIRESFARLKGHGGLQLGGSHARHEAQFDGVDG